MADGKVEFDTAINTDGIEKGVKKIQKNLNVLKGAGLTAVISAEVKALKKLVQGIDDTAQAYNNQLKAEKMLEASARNNPYLDETSVKQLKEFASQMQSISTIGDEQLIPLMSQLASAGRTQAEIQKIISTAMDVSASGMMSLDSAVSQLNATYSGNVGLMGRQITELKNLTAEELASGKAVDIMSEKFAGMSKSVTDATGSYQQMKNAQGDFNEALGKITKPTSDLWNNFWKGWYENGIKRVEALNAKLETISERNSLEAYGWDAESEEDMQAHITEMVSSYSDAQLESLEKYYKSLNKANTVQKVILGEIEGEIYSRELNAEKVKKEAEAEAERAKAIQDANDAEASKNKTASDAYSTFQKTIADAEKEIALRRSLGETITAEDEAQQMLNVKSQAYIQLLEDADGTITGTSERELKFVRELNEEYKKYADLQKQNEILSGADSVIGDAKDFIGNDETSMSASIDMEIKLLEEYIATLSEADENYEKFVEKKNELDKLREKVVEQETKNEVEKNRESLEKMADTLNSYFTQFADITTSITELISQANEEQTESDLTALSEEYTNGLVSYEEYCEKKNEIDKESALKEYKLNMWKWSASLLTATANIAQGITKAFADDGALGLISGALLATSGAIQIASIMASKPQKPSGYASGGIVGATAGGDNTFGLVGLRTGEMVLNASQQKQLWETANGKGGAGGIINMPVTIENKASDNVSASAGISADGLKITIDKIVASSMRNGRYNSSMNYAESNKSGVSVL